jgi:hypothetical protein
MVNTRGGTDKSQNWLTFLRTHSLGGPAATLNDRPKSASHEVFRVDRVKVHQKCTSFVLDWAKNVNIGDLGSKQPGLYAPSRYRSGSPEIADLLRL